MTRERIYGTDVPFCDWMRKQPTLDSSHFVATDVDLWVHAYRMRIDNERSRRVQGIQFLEIKTRGGLVPESQRDTLFKVHRTTNNRTANIDNCDVCNMGVSFVRLSHDRPDQSDWIRWGRFAKSSCKIVWHDVSVEKLESLMLMDHDPQTLENVFRRLHHKTNTVWEVGSSELGFTVATPLTQRS